MPLLAVANQYCVKQNDVPSGFDDFIKKHIVNSLEWELRVQMEIIYISGVLATIMISKYIIELLIRVLKY